MLTIKRGLYLLMAIFALTGCEVPNNVETSVTDDNTSIMSSLLSKRSVAKEKATNWYIRLHAEDLSRHLISSNAQLGVLDENNATAKHALEALPPIESGYIDIVFQNPAGIEAGEYQTIFQQFSEGSEYRWRFTIRTDNPNANVALTWRGLYVLSPYIDDQDRQRYKERRSMTDLLIQNMRLVDMDTGNTVKVVSGNMPKVYYFNMNGKTEKSFEWVVMPDSSLPLEESK